jgi:hypothetical protein
MLSTMRIAQAHDRLSGVPVPLEGGACESRILDHIFLSTFTFSIGYTFLQTFHMLQSQDGKQI